jgi:phosphatidylglycerol lysyltransferase
MRAWLRHLPALAGVVLLVVALYVIQRELAGLKVAEVLAALDDLPARRLWQAGLATVLSYVVLTFYDLLGTRFVGNPLSYGRVAFASFTAYALAHNIGFAMLSGAAIRYRLYVLWGLSPLQIAGVVAFTSLTFVLGGLSLGGISLIFVPYAIPVVGPYVPRAITFAVGVAMLALVVMYALIGKFRTRPLVLFGTTVPLPGPRMALMQIFLATADVAIVAAIFEALLPPIPELGFLGVLAIYVTAYTMAMLSHVPGGLGVFDTLILVGLTPYLPPAEIVGAILVFRLLYYILPLFLAGGLFAANEIIIRRIAVGRLLAQSARWGDPVVVPALAGAVTLAGAALLFVGGLPPVEATLAWAGVQLSKPIVAASQFIASIAGAALLVLAYGLARRVTIAWAAVLVLLVIGIPVTLARGEGFVLSGLLFGLFCLLVPFRGNFYRDTRLRDEPLSLGRVAAIGSVAVCAVSLAFFAHTHPDYADATWWAFVLSDAAPWTLRALVLLLVGLALAMLTRLLRPARIRPVTLEAPGPGRAEAAIVGEDLSARIPFTSLPGLALALGDPVGEPGDAVSAIWRFRDFCEQEGVDPAFWDVGDRYLSIYNDIGLTAFPLGPDRMPLPPGSGQAPAAERWLVCQAERDLPRLLPILPALAAGRGVPIAAQ